MNILEDSAILSFNPRELDLFVHVDTHELAIKTNANIWTIETNVYAYRTALTKATELKDHRIRVGWNETFNESIDYLTSKNVKFNVFIATEFLSTQTTKSVEKLDQVLIENSKIYLLEPSDSEKNFEKNLSKLEAAGYKITKTKKVSFEARSAMEAYIIKKKIDFEEFKQSLEKKWFIVEAVKIK